MPVADGFAFPHTTAQPGGCAAALPRHRGCGFIADGGAGDARRGRARARRPLQRLGRFAAAGRRRLLPLSRLRLRAAEPAPMAQCPSRRSHRRGQCSRCQSSRRPPSPCRWSMPRPPRSMAITRTRCSPNGCRRSRFVLRRAQRRCGASCANRACRAGDRHAALQRLRGPANDASGFHTAMDLSSGIAMTLQGLDEALV
jgi:hypothetical protein